MSQVALERPAPRSFFVPSEQQHEYGPDGETERRLEALPIAVYMTDARGRITFYNEAAAELWGFRPALGAEQLRRSWRLFRSDGTPLPSDDSLLDIALKEQWWPINGVELAAERFDGTRVSFVALPSLLRDSVGAIVGAINVLVKIPDRKRAKETRQHVARPAGTAAANRVVQSTAGRLAQKEFSVKGPCALLVASEAQPRPTQVVSEIVSATPPRCLARRLRRNPAAAWL